MVKRKLAFYEIGNGKFAQWMQEAFEDSQKQAFDRGKECKVTATITVSPPNRDQDRFGQVMFNVKISTPPRQSIKVPVEVDSSGTIISDSISVVDGLLQLDMFKNEFEFKVQEDDTNGK